MSNGQIFISYRRDDSAGYARALYDRLVQHFSKERVFMDVDAIEPGLPFDEAIKRALDRCEVLLVVIGKRWMDSQAGTGLRINDPKDFVRLEIAAGLSRDIRVVPVLLDGARMPTEGELPEPLCELARRNAIEISNSRFDSDTESLILAVRKALGESADAAKNTSGLLIQDMRPDINGEWEGDVTYDWQDARYVENFVFRGEGDEVYGTASFLGTKKGILEGSIKKDGLRFITRTQEIRGGDWKNPKDVVHRYRGRLLGNELKFIMQTEGGYSEHVPIEFIAKKLPNPSLHPKG
jgi:hypothetical protein